MNAGEGVPMGAAPDALPRRGVDRAADAVAVVMMVAALVLLLGTGWAAITVHGKEAARAVTERESRTRVTAVLSADAAPDGAYPSSTAFVRVPARWIDAHGAAASGTVLAHFGADAGDQVEAWLDDAGAPVPAPADRGEVVVSSVLAGFAVLALGGLVLAGAWAGAEQVLGLARRRYWEREWARVEPRWRPGRSADQN